MAAINSSARRVLFVVTVLALVSASPLAAAQLGSTGSADASIYRIHVHEDGDATWTVELRRQLDTEQEVESFRNLQSEFRDGNITVFEGLEGDLEPLVREAANETERQMTVRDFDREVVVEETVTGTTGIARVEFNWTNFARMQGQELMVGDVFVGSGLVIGADQRLVLTYDSSLRVTKAVPEPDVTEDGSLEWRGERFFDAERPSVTLSSASAGGFPLSAAALIAGVVVLISGFFGGVYIGRRMGYFGRSDRESVGMDRELMTDEDQIVSLLDENGGRMKQADIVDRTGWSKSKVSMVLSDMEEKEVISKLRLGRENVIDLETDE